MIIINRQLANEKQAELIKSHRTNISVSTERLQLLRISKGPSNKPHLYKN